MTRRSQPRTLFAYLVQGRSEMVERFSGLQCETSDLFFLTYDEELKIPDACGIYDPEVSWAGGRNKLLELAQTRAYDYLVFLDDDVKFTLGSFSEFERLLKRYRPYVGIPLVDEIQRSGRWCPRLDVQVPVALDQIVQAFSSDAVKDGTLIPYSTDFDQMSWWYSCEINQHQILSKFREKVAQFNSIRVTNSVHSWNEGVVAPGSSYKGGVTREGLREIRDFLLQDSVTPGKGPWEKLGQEDFIPQVHHHQFLASLRGSLSLTTPVNLRKRLRKLREALRQLGSLLLYSLFWRKRRVLLCLPFRERAGHDCEGGK